VKNVLGSTMPILLQHFKVRLNIIAGELEPAGNFKSRGELGEVEKSFLDKVMNNTLADSECKTALFRLTVVLQQLSKRKVVVLIDEYDTPTSYAARHGYFEEVCAWPFIGHGITLTLLFGGQQVLPAGFLDIV
jgi:hypothetical protein